MVICCHLASPSLIEIKGALFKKILRAERSNLFHIFWSMMVVGAFNHLDPAVAGFRFAQHSRI